MVLPGTSEVPDAESPGPFAPDIILLESLHKHGCFTYFLSGANAFRPLPFLCKLSVDTVSFWFLFYGLAIISP